MPNTNRQWKLVHRPTSLVTPDVLHLSESPILPVSDGQALARVKYLSIDPTMRVWMADIPQYMPPVQLGEVMRSFGLAEIIESRHPDFKKGDKVSGLTGLQDYVLITGDEKRSFQKVPSIPFLSDTNFLNLLGINGLTAYFGLLEIGKPQSGETLVVSAAAGATGSIAGQLGKNHGCRVVGIAGTDEKCKWIKDDLGFDAAINYKHSDWKEQLTAATPKGVDINFENVGGPIMQAVLDRMNLHGRVALCGLISGYTSGDPSLASFGQVLIKRLRVEGFIILDYASRFREVAEKLGMWKMTGKLKTRETLVKGLEKAPDTINMLFQGDNIGKLILEL
ncbi:MAG TPA: NADP-dependent oxidoreductase [Candidatus Eisenbacteria bacterium]|nr:NADP-dependent oxidoreductase [Candidatus Eisenbacteria bacterium]